MEEKGKYIAKLKNHKGKSILIKIEITSTHLTLTLTQQYLPQSSDTSLKKLTCNNLEVHDEEIPAGLKDGLKV
jgi:hypothetical protein